MLFFVEERLVPTLDFIRNNFSRHSLSLRFR